MFFNSKKENRVKSHKGNQVDKVKAPLGDEAELARLRQDQEKDMLAQNLDLLRRLA